jgi:hypothetical protein
VASPLHYPEAMANLRYATRTWQYVVNEEPVMCAVCKKPVRPRVGAVQLDENIVHALCWLAEGKSLRKEVASRTA